MDLREMILQEAILQFQQKGLKFTMQDIAEQLHISKKTIYTVFSTKEDLLKELLDYGYENIHAAKKKIIESDLPLLEKTARVITAMPEQYTSIDFRKLEGLGERYPQVFEALRMHLVNDWEPTVELLREGIDKGLIRPVNLHVLQLMIASAINTFTSTNTLEINGIGYQEALHEMMDIIMEGIKTDYDHSEQ